MDTRRFCLVVAAMALVGLAIRLIGIERPTLWFDEVKTAHALALPALDLIRERLDAFHSPAFFLLLKVLSIPTDSIFLLRLPAAFFGAATVVAGIFAARALMGARAGWMAGLLFTITPILVDYGREARPYTAMIFGVVVAIWGAAWVLRHPRSAAAAVQSRRRENSRRDLAALRAAWLLLIGGSVWAAFMLPIAGLLVWVALDCAIAWLALCDRAWRPVVRPWIAHRILCIVIFLPLAVGLVSGILSRVGNYWFTVPSNVDLWQQAAHALLFQFQGDQSGLVGSLVRAVLVGLLIGVAIFGALKLQSRPASGALALPAFLLPLLALGIVTIHTPVWIDRYLLIATPAFTLLLATGLAAAWPWPLGRAIVYALLGLSLFQLSELHNGSRRADWRPLVATLSSAPHDVFLVAAHFHQIYEIKFEWGRQQLPGEPIFATFGIGGHPRPDATYLLLREPNYMFMLRGLASGYDRRDWQQWLEQMGVDKVDLSSAVNSSQQLGAEYRPGLR